MAPRGKKAYGVTPWGARLRAQLSSMGTRIERGEALARTGKVYDTQIRGGAVRTRVKGSYAPYYDVSCAWEPLPAGGAAVARGAVARDLALAAELAAGGLPVRLLDTLEEAGVFVLPREFAELHGDCTCPDNRGGGKKMRFGTRKKEGEPCKHQAALMFELIGELDKNPATLLALRGIGVADILGGGVGVQEDALAYPLALQPMAGKARRARAGGKAAGKKPESRAGKKEPERAVKGGVKSEPMEDVPNTAVAGVQAAEVKARVKVKAEPVVKAEPEVEATPAASAPSGRRRSSRISKLAVEAEKAAKEEAQAEAQAAAAADAEAKAEAEMYAALGEPPSLGEDELADEREESDDGASANAKADMSLAKAGPLSFPRLSSSARIVLQTLSPRPNFSKEDFLDVLRGFYTALTDKKAVAEMMAPLRWEAELDVDAVQPVVERARYTLVLPASLSPGAARVLVESDLWDARLNDAEAQAAQVAQASAGKGKGKKRARTPKAEGVDGFSRTPQDTLGSIPYELDARDGGPPRVKITLDTLRRLFMALPATSVVGSASFRFFSAAVRIASLLYGSANFVPDVMPLRNVASWTVVWRPLISNGAVQECIRILKDAHPKEPLVFVRAKKGSSVTTGLDEASGSLHALTVLLTYFVCQRRFNGTKKASAERLAFFDNEAYSSVTLSDRSSGIVVKRWLSVFGLLSLKAEILLKLDEASGDMVNAPYSLELYFRDEAAEGKTGGKRAYASGLDPEEQGWCVPQKYAESGGEQSRDALKFIVALKDYIPKSEILLNAGRADIETEEFQRLIVEKAGALRALGASLVLPRGIKDVLQPRLVNEVSIGSSDNKLSWRKQYLEMSTLMEFNYKIVIGDQTLDIEHFQKMVDSGKKLFRFGNSYVSLDPQNVANIMLKSKSPVHNGESGLGLLRDLVSGNPEYQLTEDVSRLISNLQVIEDFDMPTTIQADLRGYQVTGYKWMMSNLTALGGCALLDDMGLGKTVQTICVIAHLKETGATSGCPCIVVCPTSLLSNWKREIKRFAPSVVVRVVSGARRPAQISSCVGSKRRPGSPDVLLMSYGTVRTDEASLRKHSYALLVLDEAQYVKNHASQVAKACKAVGTRSGMRLALTGTVVENKLAELHACFDFILPGYLGKLKFFVDRFSKPIERDRDEDALNELKRMTAPFMLRRLKTDSAVISDLPEKVENKRCVSLSPEQIALYEAVREETFNALDSEAPLGSGIKRSGLVLKLLTSLKQICNHPASFGQNPDDLSPERSDKCMALFDILEPIIENGEKVLIFSQYVRMCKILEKQIAERFGVRALVFDGSLTQTKRDEVVRKFERDPGRQVLVLSLKAGGVGLNLTAANHCVMFDRWYNPSVESQATDRAFRIGQKKNVFVHKMMCSDTFEMKIDEMIEQKKEIANLTVGQGENWIGKMSDTELQDLFALGTSD